MDGQHFDALARQLGSRRTAIGGLLAGLTFLPLEAAARKKGRARKRRGKNKRRARAQDEPCWRAGACIVSTGSNVSRCDLAGYTAPDELDCTRCNLSRSNLRGADLSGVNFTRANLSGACLVNADFTGAIFTNTTNLYNAIFCNTTMPDGSVNNSGCSSGTPCCPTCDVSQLCTSGCCNTVGGTCGACPNGSTCGGGNPGTPGICSCIPTTCQSLGKTCGEWPDGCSGMLSCGTCGDGCICSDLGGGSGTVCREAVVPTCTPSCDQCPPADMVCIVASNCPTGIACAPPCSCGPCGDGCICSDLGDGGGRVCRQAIVPTCTPSCDQCSPADMVCIVASNCPSEIACAPPCT